MTKTREHVVPSTVFLPHTRGRSGEWGKARRNLEVPLKALHTFRERERLEVRVAVHHVSFFHLLLCFAFSFSFLSHRPPPASSHSHYSHLVSVGICIVFCLLMGAAAIDQRNDGKDLVVVVVLCAFCWESYSAGCSVRRC